MKNVLAYYQKLGDVAEQMESVMARMKNKKPVKNVGFPRDYSPEELLNFHKERIRILEVAISAREDTIRDWIGCATKRLSGDANRDFETIIEIKLLEVGLID